MRKPRAMIALLALFAFALMAAGCARIGKPTGWASPEIQGSLYVSLDHGHMSSLDPDTYQVQWTFPPGDQFACGGGAQQKYDLQGIYESPVVTDDTVYIGAYDGAVYAVNKEDHSCKWRFETGDPIVGGLVLTDEGLYVPSEDGFVYLLKPADGSVITKQKVGDVWSTPLVTADAVYVGTIDGKFWKLKRETLDPVWDRPFSVSSALLTQPTLVDANTVLVGGIGKKLYAVSTNDGSQKWSVGGSNWYWGRPLVADKTIYATNLGGEVQKIDATNGTVEASFSAAHSLRAGVVLAGDMLVAVNDNGQVYRLSADKLELQGQPNELQETVHATPIVLGTAAPGTASPSPSATATGGADAGKVLISTESGNLWLLDVTKGQTTQVVRS